MKMMLFIALMLSFSSHAFAANWICESTCVANWETRGQWTLGDGNSYEDARRAAAIACHNAGGYSRNEPSCLTGPTGGVRCALECLHSNRAATAEVGYGDTRDEAYKNATLACEPFLNKYRPEPNYGGWASVGACRQ